ncbi:MULTISPECIES: hypothetical protein [Streptomyces]|uniref:Uncharacterized protein n=1 Tax=Streptomyces flaveolus TaxID=67297 RepID=A0ABV3AQ08_9ACTN|nr:MULTISPECIES: hypothetical protein [Streptomyces]KOG75922.1 hypothetical protein ADK77_00255 [Streptomyces antibioticus]KOX01834.1 hypothetical protein ADL02_01700 [Streptomyces sp. NRRL WC-3723]MBG7699219.1 hypothetical protein [Streptomyces sp. MC1]
MGSVTPTARNIEITAESLREDLARLEVQKQALERELSAVTAHLDSVQRALSALQALLPMAAASSAAPGPVEVRPSAEPAPERRATPASPTQDADESRGTSDRTDAEAEAETDSASKYGKLTEQILAYFAEVADTDVRARDVAAALGRDTDSGSINAVRSTLDRLVGASRIRRVGRGLYRAAKP